MKGPDTREHCTVKFLAKRLADGWRQDQVIENREKEYRSALRSGQKFSKHKIGFLFLENSVMSIR